MSRRFRPALLILGLATVPLLATEVVWPTTLSLSGVRSAQDYLQPTVSGKLESAVFGMVREEGQRFHEGVDIRPGRLDAAGEALDLVRAAMDGQVSYVNPHVNGPYGKYVVLTHPGAEIPAYSLYAHLASIDPSVKTGAFVRRGLILGRMGRTSAGASPITAERAHLHFEVGLLLSTGFNGWYAAQPENRKSPNLHGLYNGQNLIGMDPLPVLGQRSVDLLSLVRRQPTALTVVLRAAKTPDFVARYRVLARGEAAKAAGWHVEFSWQGMPLRWTALEADDPRLPAKGWQIAEIDVTRRPLLIRRKMLAADGRKPGELLTQNVGILLSTAR